MAGASQQPEPESKPPSKIVAGFERVVVIFLMALLMVVVAISSTELAWILFQDLTSGARLPLDIEEMFELFGFFLLVLIGLELLSTLKAFVYERVVHVEVVLEVALIAIAQKIIVLDTSRAGAATLLGLSSMTFALAAAFWLIRIARKRRSTP